LRFLPRPVPSSPLAPRAALAEGAVVAGAVVAVVVVAVVVAVVAAAVAVVVAWRESGDGSRAAAAERGNLAAPCRPGEGRLPVRRADSSRSMSSPPG